MSDIDDQNNDELIELLEMYRATNKEWLKKKKKPEVLSVRLRKILSLIMKKSKKRRQEVQEYRYARNLKKHGL